YETTHILVDPAGAGPMVCDMDGDGDNDLVATVTDAQGRPACVIFDGHGKVKCRFDLLPGMTALSRGPSGRLGRGQGRWLILRMSGEGPDHADRQLVVPTMDGPASNCGFAITTVRTATIRLSSSRIFRAPS